MPPKGFVCKQCGHCCLKDQAPGQEKYSCRIQAMKPEICRVFPESREHAEEKGCTGFGTIEKA